MRDSNIVTYVYDLYVEGQYRASVDMPEYSSLLNIVQNIHHIFPEGTLAGIIRHAYYEKKLTYELVYVGHKVVDQRVKFGHTKFS